MPFVAGMRGNFLGEASVDWQDLEIGQELILTLVQREGVKSGLVKGTIKLLVEDPMAKAAGQQSSSPEDSTAMIAKTEQVTSGVTDREEVK